MDSSATENSRPSTAATLSTSSVAGGRKLTRRRMVPGRVGGSESSVTSARPRGTARLPCSRSASTSSITNSGFPAAQRSCPDSAVPGGEPATASASATTAGSSSAESVSCAAPELTSSPITWVSSGRSGKGRSVTRSATGRSVRARPMPRTARRVDGSAQCRSPKTTTTGRSVASRSSRSTDSSMMRNPRSAATVEGWGTIRPASPVISLPILARSGSAEPACSPKASISAPSGRSAASSSAAPDRTWNPALGVGRDLGQ